MNSNRFVLVVFSLVMLCALANTNADDKIKSRSPDGKFAMHLAEDSSELIEVKSGKALMELDEVGPGWAKDSKLVWSPDSKYFAHFSENRRGGSTIIYRQKGDDEFEKAALPEFPDCEKKNVGKEFEASLEPKCWLNATTLVLLAREAWTNEDDPDQTGECERTITIAFDSSGKASVKQVKKAKK
jgi:hypothetical protein